MARESRGLFALFFIAPRASIQPNSDDVLQGVVGIPMAKRHERGGSNRFQATGFRLDFASPGWIALRVADSREHAGVVFYDLERFKAHQIGSLARAIAAVLDQTKGNLKNRWITLH